MKHNTKSTPSLRSRLASHLPSTPTVLGATVVVAGIASAANVGTVLSPLPTSISTGDTIEASHITNMAESIAILDNRSFQKDGSEARFNFPYLSTGNARPAGTEVHIWDDGTLQVPHKIDTGIIQLEVYADEASLPSSVGEGTLAYVSGLGLYAYDGTAWLASGSGGGNTQPAPDPIPANITLTAPNDIIIASVNDSNYIPITGPDGTADPTVDFQGSIDTTGRSISIPYTVTGATATLPAYSQSFAVDAGDTQDGQSRTLTLTYPSQSLAVGSGTITATLKAEEGTLNAKKLDIDQNYQEADWLTLATFTLPLDYQNSATVSTKVAPGIPDANFGDGEHDFLYTPITAADGTVWLNNNLGAEYNNVHSPHFNPLKQGSFSADSHLSYGSLFQWGRPADGHELITCTDPATCTYKYGSTSSQSGSIAPENNLFVASGTNDWTTADRGGNQRKIFLNKSDGTGICPVGFRVPTESELEATRVAEGITNRADYLNSVFSGMVGGYIDIVGNFNSIGSVGYIMTQDSAPSVGPDFYRGLHLSTSQAVYNPSPRGYGVSVRCIQN